jgi:nucleoid-associated protein YgaU
MKNPIVCLLAVVVLAFAGAAGAEEPDSRSGDPAQEQRMQPPAEGTTPGEGQQRERETPPVEAPPPQASEAEEYVVEEGDTLASIAEHLLGSKEEWKRIAEANGIDDPESLQVGQRLQIPARGTEHPARATEHETEQ